MCGISGIAGFCQHGYITVERLQRMTDVLRHRGPDDHGIYLSPQEEEIYAGLGHRRLSIVDLAGGHQPMCNEDGTIWITYNGEIYNHQEIRAELEARGHRYSTRSDTETIIHAYEEYGPDCVHKFRGMFAFAIWDNRHKRLFAARDRLGIKPLYYALHNENLLFASEMKALLASQLLFAAVNDQALPEFFTFGQTGDHTTLFRGIYKLMPGHWLIWDGKQFNIQQYWDWQFDESQPYQPDDYYLQRFIELLQTSVRLRLMSDVPLGMFLSGGLDSSVIAAVMAQQVPEAIQTFSVGFEQQYYSEFNFARVVAEHIKAKHHEVVVTLKEFFDALPKLIWHEDEPLKGPASVALYFVSKLAREYVTVVLTGEGSDELFAGYNDRYWVTLFNRRLKQMGGGLLPESVRKHLVRRWLWQLPLSLRLKKAISHSILYLSPTLEGMLFDNFYSVFTREMQQELFSAPFYASIAGNDPYANALNLIHSSNAQEFLHQMLYTDVKMYLLELLMKQDQMSMAASIESRVPFLDHILVEFAGTVPPYLRLQGRTGKWLVKQAAERLLPSHIVHRPKMGFPVPFAAWLKEESFVRDILLDEQTRQRGYFNTGYIEKLLKAHQNGQRDCHSQLWMLLNFELWQRVFFDNKAEGVSW
jgi:asparagine synthase (glutamine-hydrolysing)